MSDIINTKAAQEKLNEGIRSAEAILDNPEEINRVLDEVNVKAKKLPVISSLTNDLPVMVNMVRCYITKEYPKVSPKVIASMVGAFIYLIKRQDLISDDIPLIGMLDDIAVFALALQMVKPELKEFSEWYANRPAPQAAVRTESAPEPEAAESAKTEQNA